MSEVLLISIHPKYVTRILSGEKKYEYRKLLPSKSIKYLVVYATIPLKRLVAIVEVKEVLTLPSHKMWEETKALSGIDESFFYSYFKGKKNAHAFHLGKIIHINERVAQKYKVTPPQSFSYLEQKFFSNLLKDIESQSPAKVDPQTSTKICFVAGIHGVGKTTFCNSFFENTWHITSASQIIKDAKGDIKKDKKTTKIIDNQQLLCLGLDILKDKYKRIVLDGHFTLLNEKSKVVSIPFDIFMKIKPNAIILLIDKATTIAQRLSDRDFSIWDVKLIETFQQKEIETATTVSKHNSIPLMIYNLSNNDFSYELLKQFIANI